MKKDVGANGWVPLQLCLPPLQLCLPPVRVQCLHGQFGDMDGSAMTS